MSVATAPRELFKIKIRKNADSIYCKATEIKSLFGNRRETIHHLLYYPEVMDVAVLADIVNRVSWYLPRSSFSQPMVSILVSNALLDIDPKSLKPPLSQHNYIGNSDNISLISRKDVDFSKADAIMLWDKWSLPDPRLLWHFNRVNIVDPTYYSEIESATYRNLYYQTIEDPINDQFRKLSRENYWALLDKASGYSKGYVFCTGPSLDQAFKFDYADGFNVVCNSIVKNKRLLKHINPHLLVFADQVFHFSPCRYSAEFRKMMLEAVKEYQCHIIIPVNSVPLYLAHYPELEDKIIGMPGQEGDYNFPTVGKFYIKDGAWNIMTLYMVPVASAVANKIFIIGADGRKPDEDYFWRHSFETQFNELMQTAFDTHPSFFRDRVYTDYYEHHCKFLEGMIHYGESLSKKYYCLTPSYIPVLKERHKK